MRLRKFGELRFRHAHVKRTNRCRFHHIYELCHHCLLCSQFATAIPNNAVPAKYSRR